MRIIILFLALSVLSKKLTAQTITIGTAGDFPNLSAAEASINPGDTVLILDEVFTAGTQFLTNVNGTASEPVVILAETMHQPVFQGGSEAIHLINCNYLELNGLVFEQQTANGVNIDDGGDYTSPSTNLTIKNCVFRDISTSGNHDFLKMSGVDDFVIENCSFTNGTGGSGVDFVGCHNGTVQDCTFDNAGISGIQAKGGTRYITIQRNILTNMSERALNLGGNTGLVYFRPPLSNPIADAFEAADLNVQANIFIGNKAPIAYVGSVRVKVINNTFYKPENWVMRILQETTEPGFLTCSDNEFSNNIIYLESDLTEVNIGSNTDAGSFLFTNNLWFNESSASWTPNLPVTDPNQTIGDPLFSNSSIEDFTLQVNSPAISSGQSALGPITDFDQIPYSTPPSIGAYEGDSLAGLTDSETNQSTINVYPNPSSGLFTLDLGGNNEVYRYILVDLDGRKIQSKRIEQDDLILLKIEESKGIYFLIVKSEKRNEVFRLVKE